MMELHESQVKLIAGLGAQSAQLADLPGMDRVARVMAAVPHYQRKLEILRHRMHTIQTTVASMRKQSTGLQRRAEKVAIERAKAREAEKQKDRTILLARPTESVVRHEAHAAKAADGGGGSGGGGGGGAGAAAGPDEAAAAAGNAPAAGAAAADFPSAAAGTDAGAGAGGKDAAKQGGGAAAAEAGATAAAAAGADAGTDKKKGGGQGGRKKNKKGKTRVARIGSR